MNASVVACCAELHEVVTLRDRTAQIRVFRGQRDDPEWKLVPKAGRGTLSIPDHDLLRAWERYAPAYSDTACQSDWDRVVLAHFSPSDREIAVGTGGDVIAVADGRGRVWRAFPRESERPPRAGR